MKKVVSWLFLLLILASAACLWVSQDLSFKAQYLLNSPCQRPVEYKIGYIDDRFGVSTAEFLDKTQAATDIWSDLYGQSLFIHNPAAVLTVNMIYSQGQSALDQVNRLEGNLGSGKTSLNNNIIEYEKLVADFNRRLDEFNREVAHWNEKQGAPAEIFDQLISRQADLKAEADRLNAMAEALNLQVGEYNFQVGQFNQGVTDYNQLMAQKPEAGVYDGSVPKIDIYITISDQELIHTLAHEFGHAVSLDHVDDPQAIMYAFTSETTRPSMADRAALEDYCRQTVVGRYLRLLLDNWQLQFAEL